MKSAAYFDGALGLHVDVDRLDQRDAERRRQRLSPDRFVRLGVASLPLRGKSTAEVRDPPCRREPAVVDPRRVGRRPHEARMRPRRAQSDDGLIARGDDAKLARALDFEIELEAQGLSPIGGDAACLRLHTVREQSDAARPGYKSLRLSVPVQTDASCDAAGIADPHAHLRLIPQNSVGNGTQIRQLRGREPPADLQARGVHDHGEESAPPFGRLDVSIDLERFRQEVVELRAGLLASARIDPRIAIRYRQHRSADDLLTAPVSADLVRHGLPSRGSLRNHSAHHRQRHVQRQQQDPHHEQPQYRRRSHPASLVVSHLSVALVR